MLDANALFNDIAAANGIKIGQNTLTTAFLGGLFSLDGMHPTNTGYALIANEAIKAMNAAWGMSMRRFQSTRSRRPIRSSLATKGQNPRPRTPIASTGNWPIFVECAAHEFRKSCLC